MSIDLGDNLSDEISSNSSTQQFNKVSSKIEKFADSSEEISTDSLNQSDKLQTSLDGINEAKIGQKEIKDNSSNELIVGDLNINSLRYKFEFLEKPSRTLFYCRKQNLMIHFLQDNSF